MLETGFHLDSLQRAQSFTTYESHVLFALRFMIDCNISGGSWVELKRGAYKLLAAGNAHLLEWKANLHMMLLELNYLLCSEAESSKSNRDSGPIPSLAPWHSIRRLQVYLLSTWEKKRPADYDDFKMAEC